MARSPFAREPVEMAEPLDAGRRSFQLGLWADAHAELAAADDRAPLAVDDLERLAMAAYLVGADSDCEAAWTRAHHDCLHNGDPPRAARNALWLALALILRGELAPAGGWCARAARVLTESGRDCAERGLLLVFSALRMMFAGDPDAALPGFGEALVIAERFGDRDGATLARLGRGQALVLGGQQTEGVAALDEVMVAVTAGEVSPILAGLSYCAVIETCQMTFDLRRAKEWTAALSRWCESQPDLVPYRGQCLIHRAEILQVHGAWPEAMEEAARAHEQLARPPVHPALGAALYRQAELLRLRGELGRAAELYGRASERGRDPQPGLALTRLAEGQLAVADAAIRRALDEAIDPVTRAHLLAAYVEIVLAAGDEDSAQDAADELTMLAAHRDSPVLRAMAAYAAGTVHLARGDGRAALAVLRPAWATWRDLEAPYEAARVRLAVGTACRQLGDEDGAMLEFQAAADAFRALGAQSDLVRTGQLLAPPRPDGLLSGREREVLSVLATGMTNREIAGRLVISEKTVARHVANIFVKLGVSSRSAATAYAYENGVVGRRYTE
jgi:DNA-binding CsgD family transcriptional regulator